MSRVTDLTCNETMPPSDEKLEPRPGGYRPGGYGLPSTSTGQPRFANQLPKPQASRALYPGSLIPSMSGLPHGLSLPGASPAAPPQKAAPPMTASQLAFNSPQTTAAIMALHQQLQAHPRNAAATTQREQQLRQEAQRQKEEEEKLKKTYEDARNKIAFSAPSTSTAPPPGIIRPTPTMPGPYGNPMLNSLPSTSSASRQFNPLASLATHDYMGSSLPPPASIREPQVKQIPKGGGLVHAPYTPLSKSRMEAQRDPQSSHSIARPIARHADQSNAAAQYALNQAAQAQQEAVQARHKLLKEQRDAENAAELQRIQRERQLLVSTLLDRQRQEEERQLRAEMNAVAPIVRPAQRGAPNQPPLVDPVRLNRAVPPQNNHRLMQHSNVSSLTTAFANATAAAEQAAARAQKEKDEREAFERERDMMERAAAEPMQLPPPIHHQSPMHIPNILAGRNNWPKSPLRPGYSPGLNSSGLTSSGMPSFDHLLGGLNSSYSRLHNLFGVNPPHGIPQHVSPRPSTPQVHATPSPRPSILRRGKNNDASGAKRRLGFDESNPQTVGELATAQLNSGVIGGGLSEPKKIKIEEIKAEVIEGPSTSYGCIPPPAPASAVKQEPGVPPTTSSAEPTPKKRQRKQQFDANQAPEQIRMQISEPAYMPIMGMHSAEYPGEMLYYQLPPEAPKKKRGRPSSLEKERALLEARAQAQSTTRSIILDLDEPKIVLEKKKGGRKKKEQAPPAAGANYNPLFPPARQIKDEPLEVPFTPPPPRPSSSARPKSAILQQHHAALQLQLAEHQRKMELVQAQQQQQLAQLHKQPQPAQQSAKKKRLVKKKMQKREKPQSPANEDDDVVLEWRSDEEFVSAEAREAAKAVAIELGLVDSDGEPRETTPMREAREEADLEEEGLDQYDFLQHVLNQEELERRVEEYTTRDQRELQETTRKEFKSLDRRLRFLSHKQSTIRKFFKKVRGHKRREELSDSEEERMAQVVAEEKDEEKKEDGRVSALSKKSGGGDSDHEPEPSKKAGKQASKKNLARKDDSEDYSDDSDVLTLTVEELKRLKDRGEGFDIVREVENDSDDDEEEESEDEDMGVERMNLEIRLNRLLEMQQELEEGKRRDEFTAEIDRIMKRMDAINEALIEDVVEDEEVVEEEQQVKTVTDEQPVAAEKKRLNPLEALGDRDNFLRPATKVLIAPSVSTTRQLSEKESGTVGKKKAVKKALGFMQLWKRIHSSSQTKEGIAVDEPIDVEGDLMRARKRDMLIERTFNKMKKKIAHDRERERTRDEIIEKRRLEKKKIDYKKLDEEGKTIWDLAEGMLDTLDRQEKEAKEKEEREKKEQEEKERRDKEEKEKQEKEKVEQEKKEKEEMEKTEREAKEKEEAERKKAEEEKKDGDKIEESKDGDQPKDPEVTEVSKNETEKKEDAAEIEKVDDEPEKTKSDASSDEEEEIADPIERERVQKENAQILRLAVEQVDAKLARKEERVGLAKSLRAYFASPRNPSVGDIDLLSTVAHFQKRNIDEECTREDLEELMDELLASSEEEDEEGVEKDEEKKADEKNEEGKVDSIGDDIEVEEDVVKMTATRKTRRDVPTEEWNSLPSSFHQTEIVDLFGIPFAKCDGQLVPVVTEEEKGEAKEDLLMKHSERTVHQIESGMELKERYQGEDSVARSITRFRRCQAVDNAMMRDGDSISDEIDPDFVEMEAQVIGFLTENIASTKREAVIEKKMADIDERNEKTVPLYKKEFGRRSIMGNYSVQYDAAECLRKGEDEVNDQHNEFVKNQYERLRAKRDKKLDKLAEDVVSLREPRQQLPGEWKARQDAAKERILNKYSKKARSLMLEAYRQFFDHEGQELNAATTSYANPIGKTSAKTEPTVLREAKMLKFLEENDLILKEIPRRAGSDSSENREEGTRAIPSTPAEWMNLLRELENAVSESDKKSAEKAEVKEEVTVKTATVPVENRDIQVVADSKGGRRRRNETFDLESIRLIYETGKEKEVKKEKDDVADTLVKVEDTPSVEKEGEEVDVTNVDEDSPKNSDDVVVEDEKEGDASEEESSDIETQYDGMPARELFEIYDTEHSSCGSDSEEGEPEDGADGVREKTTSASTSQTTTPVTNAAKKWSFPIPKEERPKKVLLPKESRKTPEIKEEEPQEDVEVENVIEKTTENEKEVKSEDSQETAVEEPKSEEKEEEQKDAEDGYEDHVVTMTRGGETITKIVRRPSNAAALMNIPRRIMQKKYEVANGSPKKRNGTETENDVNTQFYRVEDSLLIDEEKMLRDIQLMKMDAKLSKKTQHLEDKWGVTENEKEQMAKEIEDELEETQRAIRKRSRKESRKDSTDTVHSTPNSVEEAIDQAIADAEKKEEERMEEDEMEKEESDSDWYSSDEESFFKKAEILYEDSTRKDKPKKRKMNKNKSADSSEAREKAWPWLKECDAYQPCGLDELGLKIVDRRGKLLNRIEKKKEAIKPRVFRFRVPPTKKKQQYISPFNSLYENNIPDELASDLEVVKLIMTTNLGDENISNSELAILRKKINQTKKGFSEVIKRKSVEPPKAFRDLVRYAIQRGEQYNKREKEVNKIQLLYGKALDGKKTKRSERKAYLKEVKVTREKLNARFGRKFRRTDWSVRQELESRWKKGHLLPEFATPPRMGHKQFLQEMRKTREISDEHARLGLGVADMDHQKKKREARDEKKKEKGKKNAQTEKDARSKCALRDTVVLFDRLTEEIEYSDDEEINPEVIEDKYSDDSLSSTPSSDDRQRRERSWTYETVKNSDDDESFVDFGHAHWIGPQVFLDGDELSPTQEETDLVSAPPKLIIPPGAFADIIKPAVAANNVSSTLAAAQPAAPATPPRPFLTLAQRKAYFTEESEEERRKKKEEEEERIKKEQEEREELLRKEAEKAAEEKRKEDQRIAEERRIEEEARKEQKKFEGLIGQIDHNTWEVQLKMIIERVMTTFRRTDAIEYLVRSCKDMDCTERKMLRAVEQWEREAEEKRVSAGTSEFMSLKSLFNAKTTVLVRKGVNVEKKKKDGLSALPDGVLIEDLVDSMCTFISAHVDDVTLLSELRMTSEKNAVKIRTLPETPKAAELLVKKSIAAAPLDECDLVQNTLASTPFNALTAVGDEHSSIVLSASQSQNALISAVNNELLKKDRALKEITLDEFAKGIEVFKRPAIPDRVMKTEPLKSLKKNVIEKLRKKDVTDLRNSVLNVALLRGEMPDLKALKDGLEEHGSGHQFNFLRKRLVEVLIASLNENGEAPTMSIDDVPEKNLEMKNLIDDGLRCAFDGISAVREEIKEEMGEKIDEEKLDQYLAERILTNDCDSPLYLVIEDMKKHWERLRRKGIEKGEKSARVFDLSAVGQLERWVEDVFFLSPFSEEGKRVATQLSNREKASLHYQLVLRGDEDNGDIVKRIHPVIKMKWTENNEERSEVVHKFDAIPAHQWDSIQRLIKLVKDERKADGVISADEDGEEAETTVLIPIKGAQSGVVVVEKDAWTTEQERIVNNDKFADLELRHSARLLKRKKFGFGTVKAKNAWTRNHNRAYLSGRALKKIVDGHNVPEKKSSSRNLRQSIRSKAMKNSIKYTKAFNAKQVEILGNPLREKKLKQARKAVRKQKKEIRRHYKRIISAEIRKHKLEICRFALAEKSIKNKNDTLECEKDTVKCDTHLDDERLKEFGITVDIDDELRPHFRRSVKSLSPPPSNQIEEEASLPQPPINPDTVDDDINEQQDDDPEVDALGNRLSYTNIKKTPSLENSPPNDVVGNHVDSKKKPAENKTSLDKAEMKIKQIEAVDALEIPPILESDEDSFDDEENPEMEQEVGRGQMEGPSLHPLKRRIKTIEELSRPLNEREQKILAALMEKRAKGEALVSSADLNGPKTVSSEIPSSLAIEPVPVKKKVEESDVKMKENHVDEKEELLEQKLGVNDVSEEDEVDFECVLFHSYPERVRELLVKAIKRREEREEEHTRRYEMYRRGVERKMRREREQKEAEEKEKKTEEKVDVEKEKKENGKSPKKAKKNGEKAKEVEKNDVPVEWKAGMECREKDIPQGFVPMWTTKIVNGKQIRIRTSAYKKWKERRMLSRDRVIMGRVSRGRKVPLTRLHYIIDGQKSKQLVEAEKAAKKAQDEANNVLIEVDTSNVPISEQILSHFVENQVKSDDAKLQMKEQLIEEHDAILVKKGFRLLDSDVATALTEDAEIERMIDEDRSHDRQLETIKEAVTAMQHQTASSHFRDPVEQIDQEIEEAVDNERRVLADYLKMLRTMDTRRYQELVKMWTYDISSDDDEEVLVEKRWARVRQFVLQKPMGAIKDWESKTAYRDDWGENEGLPKKKDVIEILGALHPEYRGEQSEEREGYYISEEGFPIKPKKPLHFQPLESEPEYLDNSDINEWCHPDLNERHEADLVKRKIAADEVSEDFNIRQREVKQRGLKRTRELMKTFRINNRMKRKRELMAESRKEKDLPMEWTKPQDCDYDSDSLRESFHEYLKKKRDLEEKPNTSRRQMPPLGMGMEWVQPQDSVYDPMPLRESYWSYVRRTDATMDIALKRRLEHTREMFAIVVQQMHRTILVLRETKERLEHHIETKDLDPEEVRQREAESHHDSDESDKDEDEEQTYVLRKRPRLCRVEEEDDGDDEAEDSDRAPSRTDSEREDSGEEEEEEEEEEDQEDDDVIEVEVPKKPKKPTLFNRVIKREIPDDLFDLNKVKEEDPEVEADNFINPPIIDVTPKTRKQPTGRKKGRPRKSSDRSDSDSPFYEAPPTSLRRAIGKRPLANDRAAVDFYDEDEQIRLAIEESLKDQPSTSKSGN